jgi:hypothetical protein
VKDRIHVLLPRSRYRLHLEAIAYAWERGTAERRILLCQTGCDLLDNALSEIELDAKLVAQGPGGLLLRSLRQRPRVA